jgi:UDP-glucose 4-epimerase
MQCEQVAGGIYNIGSDEEVSIEELADKIIALTGSKSKKQYISYEEAYGKEFDDMMRRVPSLEKINKVIGYKPKMSLEQTLQDVISDIKSKL